MSVAGEIARKSAGDYVAVLDADPDLRATVPPDQLALARKLLLAHRVDADTGPWDDSELADPDWLGVLIIEGMLTRDVEIGGTCSRELLGRGDLIRPWDSELELAPVPARATWTILEPTTFAILDRRFALVGSRWPALIIEVVNRVMRRSRWMAVRLAIGSVQGVPERIMLLLWHLADIWGRVTPRGTLVPFSLTHELIANLIGARRPTVTSAISELRDGGRIERVEDGWLIREPPPGG